MVESTPCPECGRPLQRGRDNCIYCGYKLNEEDLEQLSEVLTDEAVQEQVELADAMLKIAAPAMMSDRARIVAKIIVVLLSVAGIIFLSWVSNWNPFIIVASIALFMLPIWQVMRRL
ncbi:MAG TPA: hypothetical protein VMX35_12905 [Acidobacteriota bacterium]|nr:hypothetical protein [Acidobacteriota bacterium]